MHLIAISTVPVYILRVIVMIWAMNLKYDINTVSVLMVISETVILLVEWGLLTRFIKPKWQIDWDFIWRTVKASRVFLAIEGMAVLKERIQVLILSLLAGEIVVGLYGSVAQLMQPFQIISYSIVIAVFPSMSKAVLLGKEKQREMAETVVEMLLIVALPFIVGLLFIGQDLLIFVYRNPSFANATTALNLMAFGLIASALTRPLSYTLVANGFEKINLYEVIISTVLGGLLSIVLVAQYKLNGAALSVLILQIISCGVYVYFVYKHLFNLKLWKMLRRPLLITTLMWIIFLVLNKINLNLLMTMLTATLAYVLIVGVSGVYAFGGPTTVYAKLLQNKRES
jgi:O-antigen/teichoic acid export membrane protein